LEVDVIIVTLMGTVYKFTKRAWRNFLEKWSEQGFMPDIDRFATKLSNTSVNITDLGIEDVKYMLEEEA
jgi:hypothetical protein